MCNYNKHRWKARWEGSKNDPNSFKFVSRGPGHIVGFIVRAFLLKLLWNLLVPSLFGGPAIGFLHAVGLLLLGKVITGGNSGRWRKRGEHRWKMKMKEKMEKMTPEERKTFKEKMMGWDVNVIEVEDDESEESDSDEKGDGKKK